MDFRFWIFDFRLAAARRAVVVGLGMALLFFGVAGAQGVLTTAEGLAVPQAGHVFEFPRDHGAHPEFKIEWWYLTGHVIAEDGRRFGYQATFFRNAAPDKSLQLHLAHMALIDVKTGKFHHQERLSRDGWDASAAVGTLDVRHGPWSLRLRDPTATPGAERLELRGGIRADVRFEFTLTPEKPLVVFGENGISRKGAEPTAASYYLTFTRLRTTGELWLGEQRLKITGQSWMDHEISSSQLDAKQVGWDWVSVQLTDGRELMFYRLRLADGSTDPASTLTWVDREGRPQKSDFTWEVLDEWTSAESGARYPSRVRLSTTDPADGVRKAFTLEPLAKNQELGGKLSGIPYWEGACRVLDEAGRDVGSAYMELTGYARKLRLE